MTLAVVFAMIVGLVIGSFLNVVAYRVPRKESLASPPSHCPYCDRAIRPYDNIPVLSWLLLRGRCRDCGESISPLYPLVEATTGVLYGLIVAVRWPDTAEIALGLILVTFLVPLTLIDLEVRRLPDILTIPAGVLAIVVGSALDPGGEVERLIAGGIAGLVFFVIAVAYPGGMGLGDVKLAAVLGLFLGRSVALAIFVALLLGLGLGVGIMAKKGIAEGRKTAVPFGPFLAAGAVVAILVGPEVMNAYLNHS
jgi:leader peptidase (prepilin peptidase) / N-methyltransferase